MVKSQPKVTEWRSAACLFSSSPRATHLSHLLFHLQPHTYPLLHHTHLLSHFHHNTLISLAPQHTYFTCITTNPTTHLLSHLHHNIPISIQPQYTYLPRITVHLLSCTTPHLTSHLHHNTSISLVMLSFLIYTTILC